MLESKKIKKIKKMWMTKTKWYQISIILLQWEFFINFQQFLLAEKNVIIKKIKKKLLID